MIDQSPHALESPPLVTEGRLIAIGAIHDGLAIAARQKLTAFGVRQFSGA